MRRLSSLGVAVLALGLVLVPAALAANPDINHFRDVGTDSDPDFCGTGKTVDIAFDVRGTEWFAPNQKNTVYRNVTQGAVWFTNPLNGKSVLNRFAGPFAITVSGDPNGLHFEDFTNRGLPEQLKLEGRKVILRDAGFITFRDSYDGDTFLGTEIIVNRGPHPEADSDFELFCEVMTDALDL